MAALLACTPGAVSDVASNAGSATPASQPAGSAPPAFRFDPHASPRPLAPDWTLPGDFAADTGIEVLRARYGAKNVRIVDALPLAEGETIRGMQLFPDDPRRRATLYFQDSHRLRGLASVSIEDAGSLWHGVNGVRIGMTLAQLVALNGRPIRYYGMGWDYGGQVIDWGGARLEPADPATRGRLSVRLAVLADARSGDSPQGDGEFSSDDMRWPQAAAALGVGRLLFSPPGADDL